MSESQNYASRIANVKGRPELENGAIELLIEHFNGHEKTGENKVAVLLSHVGLITYGKDGTIGEIRLLGTQQRTPFNRTTKIVNKPKKLPKNFISIEQSPDTLWCNMDNVVMMKADRGDVYITFRDEKTESREARIAMDTEEAAKEMVEGFVAYKNRKASAPEAVILHNNDKEIALSLPHVNLITYNHGVGSIRIDFPGVDGVPQEKNLTGNPTSILREIEDKLPNFISSSHSLLTTWCNMDNAAMMRAAENRVHVTFHGEKEPGVMETGSKEAANAIVDGFVEYSKQRQLTQYTGRQ